MISSLIRVYTAQCKCMIVETHAGANTVCTHVVLYTRFPCKCYHTKMYTVHVTYCMQQFTLVVGTVSHTSTFSIDSTWRGHTWGDIKHYQCRDIQSYVHTMTCVQIKTLSPHKSQTYSASSHLKYSKIPIRCSHGNWKRLLMASRLFPCIHIRSTSYLL